MRLITDWEALALGNRHPLDGRVRRAEWFKSLLDKNTEVFRYYPREVTRKLFNNAATSNMEQYVEEFGK